MSQSLSSILIHLVFSTKLRIPFIQPAIAPTLYGYIAGAARALNSQVYEIGGVEDHVHILLTLPRTLSTSKLVEELKKASSKWIKMQGRFYEGFAWQNGYAALSVGESGVENLRKYIQNQKTHHHKTTFQEEYRKLLGMYKIRFKEEYVWD